MSRYVGSSTHGSADAADGLGGGGEGGGGGGRRLRLWRDGGEGGEANDAAGGGTQTGDTSEHATGHERISRLIRTAPLTPYPPARHAKPIQLSHV